jgi:hypothetical protein
VSTVKEKLEAYSNAWWSNAEIAIVTGYGYAEVSKIKQQIVRAGGTVHGHGQKVYRDAACKVLGIDYKKEIEILKMIER